MALADKLAEIIDIKSRLATAIVAKGVAIPPTATFADYPDLVMLISGGDPLVAPVTSSGDAVTVDGVAVYTLQT